MKIIIQIYSMGIPSYFRVIIQRFNNIHSDKLNVDIDNLYIDFNSLVYDIYALADKKIIATEAKFEKYLINEVIKILIEMIELVKPKNQVYIAMDGTAPRAKIVQQRYRRYKGIKDKLYAEELKKKHQIEKDNIIWQTSANISPGTKFMKKMSKEIQKNINKLKIHKNLKIILSDTSIPGEGEHKYLSDIKALKNEKVVIYSPDADMIVLSMTLEREHIYILKRIKEGNDATNVEKKYSENGKKFLFISIDNYIKAYLETLQLNNDKKLITDYIFLTFFAGNDFVRGYPYLKFKENLSQGHNNLVNIYTTIQKQLKSNLIEIKNGKYYINQAFLIMIFSELAKNEGYFMRGYQIKIDRVINGQGNDEKIEKEKDMDPYHKEMVRYEHYEFYSQLHPDFEKNRSLFQQMDYKRPLNEWRSLYYQKLFYLDPKNVTEFQEKINEICKNYLESLIFTMKYYFEGLPSWSWYYRYHAPPLHTDILNYLQKMGDINKLEFKLNEPYKPFDQMMLNLPLELKSYLPKTYQKLIDNDLRDLYPINFEYDILLTDKHIYSEPILPEMEDERILESTKKLKLTVEESSRNKLLTDPMIF